MRKSSPTREKLENLAPGAIFTPVRLNRRRKVTRLHRAFYGAAVFLLSLPLFQTPAFGMDQTAARLREKYSAMMNQTASDQDNPLLRSGASVDPEQFLAAHTNSHTNSAGSSRPHTNVGHSDSPSKHVNVNSQVGHANMTRPHMNNPHVNVAHSNSPHTNSHTNVSRPDSGRERT